MRCSIDDLLGGSDARDSGRSSIAPDSQERDSDLDSILEAYGEQSASIRSIVALEPDLPSATSQIVHSGIHPPGRRTQASFLRLLPERDRAAVITEDSNAGWAHKFNALARQASDLSGSVFGVDLLLLPIALLNGTMPGNDFSFRAVAVVIPQTAAQLDDGSEWTLRRNLFDSGLVCISSVRVSGCKVLCFLASDAIRRLDKLDIEPRGYISMSNLVEDARLANQLFRYSCVKFYALRHGLTAAIPSWEGSGLYGLNDKSCAGLDLPRLTFHGFAENDRQLWERDDPPINIDLAGYFQEIPECWRRHRPLLRRLFQASPEHLRAIDSWRERITEGGRRSLVAIHVRRGDYRKLQLKHLPWFRMVPEAWYLDWLRGIWPTLSRPILFVATDEPQTVLPAFHEFEQVSNPLDSMSPPLPDSVRDFEVLRRADHLAICNSSYSRMAAILGPDHQRCFLPSFRTQSFSPYEPWLDPAFWARFEESWHMPRRRSASQAEASSTKHDPAVRAEPTILFDLTDLLSYLIGHTTVTGIQRVQCEIVLNLSDELLTQPVHFVSVIKHNSLGMLETDVLLDLLEAIQAGTISRPEINFEVRTLLKRAVPCTPKPKDIFLTIGAFWGVASMGSVLQELKKHDVIIAVFIHDIIPITAPEYFDTNTIRLHVKGLYEALTFADYILTTTEYNKNALADYMSLRKLDPLPIHLVPLGHRFSNPTAKETQLSGSIASIIEKEYVLCVGTVEVRKNPTYLFNIWKMMVRSGRPNIPYLVFVGRKGWLIKDFMDQLQASGHFAGRILIEQNVTDVELDLLYRHCILTVFPSFVEGWGLPVGESLAHGKICLCSAMGGIPEVGGELVDYIDPFNVRDGLEQLSNYLDDPTRRLRREREIADHFQVRSWRTVAERLITSTRELARQVRPRERVAAIALPPRRYLPISSTRTAALTDSIDGLSSAELICVSGWNAPESSGVRAAQPAATIQFRPDVPVGTRINLVMRLAGGHRDLRIQTCAGSGARSEISLAAGSDAVIVLPCDVEPGRIVTARFLAAGDTCERQESSGNSCWSLKGILYFDPKRIGTEGLTHGDGRADRLSTTNEFKRIQKDGSPEKDSSTRQQQSNPPRRAGEDHILLRAAALDDTRRSFSFGQFLQAADSFWTSSFASDRYPPIFADHADRRTFFSGGRSAAPPQLGKGEDHIALIRRRDQFVSTSRFSEGSIFDRSGVWKAFGYLHSSPPGIAPWLSKDGDGVWIAERCLRTAPFYNNSFLFFYNGNLHNYYHWLVEGLLCLDVLTQTLGLGSHLKIALPQSMDINAVFDHRETLRALGFDRYETIEVEPPLIRVREAIWVDSDLVQSMPAPYLKNFQQRFATLYSRLRGPRNRRLLVARKGPTRTINNIQQVQDVLSRHNFETVYLEGLSMAAQISLFQSAEFIVSPHGAGLANLLFCEPGTKIIELMPAHEMRPFFWLLSQKLDLVYGLQFCPQTSEQDFQEPITVDVNKLQSLVRMLDAHC